jgi:hypothetical protein
MMSTMKHLRLRATAALSMCLVFGWAYGQQNDQYDPDPPDRAARLSYLQGDVSLQPAGEDDWTNAIVNRPLTTGDKLWTDQGGRVEIEVGQAAVRLDNVDDDTIQMRVTAGVINVSVRALDGNDQIEIDTPNLALSLLRPGNYRVEVNDRDDTTVVKVSEGEAEVSGGQRDVIVHAQESATFRSGEQLAAHFGSLGAPDEFDSWSLERDRRDADARSSRTAQYVAPEVTGYEDLDDNGSWTTEADYGYVWTPTRVAADWSPYRYGRWVWIGPWGWTWIDDAPWGYAPFHYGRWAHVRDRWCWVPGPRHVRAVYAPALVGWVGSPGLNVSVSVGGGGGVAWFPLGPREVYVPARRFSHRYVERVNVSNTVIINRAIIANVYENRDRNVSYRNRAVPGAVTAVPRAAFTSAQRVDGHRIHIDERQIDRTTAMAPRIEPVRESRLGVGDARRNVRPPPAEVVSRQVVVRRNPPPSGTHFVRSPNQANARREQFEQERPESRGDRNVPNLQRGPDERAPPFRQHTDRPPRVDQPQNQPQNQPHIDNSARPVEPSEAVARRAMERQQVDMQQREQQQREQQQREMQQREQTRQEQGRQLQERRQAELQIREQREQQERNQNQNQQRERAMQQQRNVEQERAAAQRAESVERQQRPQQQQNAERPPPPKREESRPLPRAHGADRKRPQDDERQ